MTNWGWQGLPVVLKAVSDHSKECFCSVKIELHEPLRVVESRRFTSVPRKPLKVLWETVVLDGEGVYRKYLAVDGEVADAMRVTIRGRAVSLLRNSTPNTCETVNAPIESLICANEQTGEVTIPAPNPTFKPVMYCPSRDITDQVTRILVGSNLFYNKRPEELAAMGQRSL